MTSLVSAKRFRRHWTGFAPHPGGAIVIESIFAWPGVGQVVLTAVSGRDIPVIAGFVLLSGLVYVVVNLAVDLSYLVLDPRVRLG